MEVGEIETYKEPGVTVTEGGTNVTSNASINITYKLDGKTVNGITSETGHYEITYTIKYKDFNKTLTRKVFKK